MLARSHPARSLTDYAAAGGNVTSRDVIHRLGCSPLLAKEIADGCRAITALHDRGELQPARRAALDLALDIANTLEADPDWRPPKQSLDPTELASTVTRTGRVVGGSASTQRSQRPKQTGYDPAELAKDVSRNATTAEWYERRRSSGPGRRPHAPPMPEGGRARPPER